MCIYNKHEDNKQTRIFRFQNVYMNNIFSITANTVAISSCAESRSAMYTANLVGEQFL